jgi:dTDP-4-dehydrorhamnose 3,5-epimerase
MIKKTRLKSIINSKGNIIKLIKKDTKNFQGFGELYISKINYGSVKGWKKHTRMKMNIFVISGKVQFVFFHEKLNKFQKVTISNYRTGLFVPNNIWFAFKGVSNTKENLVMNFSNIIHKDNESINKDLSCFKYKW